MTFATIAQTTMLADNTINTIAEVASAHGMFANTPNYSASSPPGNRGFGSSEMGSIVGIVHRFHTGAHYGGRWARAQYGIGN
eukprot:CAMPEP_0114549164 /NCGR_PEP_ID=MMETSP0114-20121206/5380_1 /TAXON_ID=31324 /ORGANISM="Goniomonas sp, Strain m" /LENGTH=81 /DNA_ID=CAMNT_0001733825 /DNA_START=17 /DNA_END=262 /DNA_ORIENTATION=-